MSYIRLEIGVSEPVVEAVFEASRMRSELLTISWVRTQLLEADWCVSWWDTNDPQKAVCMGALFGKVPEIHAAVLPAYQSRWLTRTTIREFLSWYFCNYELARVVAPTPEAARILRNIGFHEEFNVYTMTRKQLAELMGLVN